MRDLSSKYSNAPHIDFMAFTKIIARRLYTKVTFNKKQPFSMEQHLRLRRNLQKFEMLPLFNDKSRWLFPLPNDLQVGQANKQVLRTKSVVEFN